MLDFLLCWSEFANGWVSVIFLKCVFVIPLYRNQIILSMSRLTCTMTSSRLLPTTGTHLRTEITWITCLHLEAMRALKELHQTSSTPTLAKESLCTSATSHGLVLYIFILKISWQWSLASPQYFAHRIYIHYWSKVWNKFLYYLKKAY